MNKKFFGFLLVIAALFSVCTLESCKDTNSDLAHEQMIKSTAQYQDLLNRINDLKAQLHDCQCAAVDAKYAEEVARLEGLLDAAKEELTTKIGETKAELEEEITEKLAELKQQVDEADAALQALIEELAARIENLAKQARSINVKAVYTNFGTFNTPFGLNNGVVIAYVPSFEVSELCGEEIEADETVTAGTIYLTVNPVSTDFAGLPVELVSTVGNGAPGISLTPLAKSDEEIVFGFGTRANQYLYETEVVANVAEVEHFPINKEDLKEMAKRIVDNKRINFHELGNVVLETLQNAKLTAYQVSLNQGDTVALASDELLAAVAVKPLNFTDMDALGTVLDKVQALAEAKLEALKAQINGFNIDIDIDGGKTIEKEINIKVDKTVDVPNDFDVIIDWDNQKVKDVVIEGYDKVEVGIDTTYNISIEIPTVEIGGLDKINDFKSIVEAMIDKATAGLSYIERLLVMANPAMFVMDESGKFCALSTNPNSPTVVNSADVVLYPSSYCLETVVPYYAKCVKVGGETEYIEGANATLATSLGNGVVEIEYAALDYAGNQSVVRKYYVKVAE